MSNDFEYGHATRDFAAAVDLSELQAQKRKAYLAQIETYWNLLRGPRLLPLRTDLDPRKFKGALDHCFALERIAPGSARFRVAGSHLSRILGQAATGAPVSALLAARSRELFGETLDEVFETPASASLRLVAETGSGRPPLRAWMNLFPVGDEGGETSRVIGAFVSEGDIGSAPRLFGIESFKVRPLAPGARTSATGRSHAKIGPQRHPATIAC